jgi:hypothetical protein
MPYPNQISNPLGADSFLQHLSEADFELLQQVSKLVDKLVKALDESSVKSVRSPLSSRRLISVAVDGGNQLIFPQFREISMGMIRVSAFSPDLKDQPETTTHIIKNFDLFDILKAAEEQNSRSMTAKRSKYIEQFFQNSPMREFSLATGIIPKDLGEHIYRDIESFTNTIRNVLEWAYIVMLAEKYRDFKILIVRDGRLEQHGVENSFVKKLREYFERNKTYLVGIVKTTKLLREGIPSLVIKSWTDKYCAKHPVYYRLPDELMKYTFGFERQWNPDMDGSFVFGNRYAGKFYANTFHTLQSVFTFDIPSYIDDDEATLEIVDTLYNHRSLLFDGSVSVVSEAHMRASVDIEIVANRQHIPDIKKFRSTAR